MRCSHENQEDFHKYQYCFMDVPLCCIVSDLWLKFMTAALQCILWRVQQRADYEAYMGAGKLSGTLLALLLLGWVGGAGVT